MLTDFIEKQPRLSRLIAWLLLVAGIGFILLRSVISPYPEIDFRFFWLAGYVWGQGLDPYSASYGEISRAVLPEGNFASAWVYPPHWWAICRFLAAFSIDQSVAIWRLVSGTMLVGGTWFVAQALFSENRRIATTIAAASAGLVCLIEPTAMLLALGQNSAFIYLGLCLLVIGSLRPSLWLDVAAILLISLKPQVGLPVILGLLVVRRYWVPIIIATAAGLILALPQLISFGPVATVQNLLVNLSGYAGGGAAAVNPNLPVSSTGLVNLVGQFVPGMTSMPGFVISIVAALVVGFFMARADRANHLKYILLLLSIVVAMVPLHVYDLPLLIIPVLILLRIHEPLGLLSLVVVVLAIRPARIEAILNVPIYGSGVSAGAIILSIGAVLLAILTIVASLSPAPCKTPRS